MTNAEKTLITKLLIYSEELDYVEKEKILSIPLKMWNKEAYDIMREYKKNSLEGRSYLEILEKPQFQKMLQDIMKIEGYSTLEKTEKLIKTLKETYYQRRLLEIAKQEGGAMEKISKLYQEMLCETEERQKENSMEDIEDLLFDGLESASRISTGDLYFDKFVRFAKKDLNIIGARPGVGKSAFSLYLALGMAKRGKGLFFNLEMTNTQLAQRICSMKTRINLENVSDKEKFYQLSKKDREDLKKTVQELKEMDLKLLDGNYSISEIRERIRMEKELYGLDFVFVDYLQLVKSFEKTEYERVTEVSRSLKLIAKEFDVVVIALSQMNRQADTEKAKSQKDIFLSDLRGSGQIEQDGSVIIGLLSNPVEPNKDLFKVKILKNRQGARGILEYHYYKSNQTFYKK